MRKIFSTLLMTVALLGSATMVSCGDDEVTPSTPSEPQTSYVDLEAYVRIEHNQTTNPFLTDKEAENKAIQDIENLISQELLKIDGVTKSGERYSYDDKKRDQIWSAIRSAMTKLEPTIQNQKLYLDGKVICVIKKLFPDESIWEKTFDYTQPSSSFTYQDIDYCVINDTEAGVVNKPKGLLGNSAYTGDVVIPETIQNGGKTYTITAIGPNAFYGSTITSISLPKTLTTLYNDCFGNTSNLKSITLPAKLNTYKSNAITDLSELKLFWNSGITEVVFEEGFTTLSDNMFHGAAELQKAVLPSTVTKLAKSTFSGCKKLNDITVNGAITEIAELGMFNTAITSLSAFKFKDATLGYEAFQRCAQLETIDIPEGVKSLGNACFAYCEKATSATIPASVTTMGGVVFAKCKALKEIHVKGDKPATLLEESVGIGSEVTTTFSDLDFAAQGITIYVPAASVDTYKKAAVWSRYADYIKAEEAK